MIYRKVLEVAAIGAMPIVLGGDHSITWPSARPSPRRAARAASASSISTRTPTPRTTDWGVLAGHGTPMRRLIESGAVKGSNFVQVGLRGYWPPPDVFAWMREQKMRWHLMREIEERGAEAVVDDAIAEALDGPDAIYLSIDIDVIDPGMAPGTGTPEPGGLLTRELLRAIRRIVGRVPSSRAWTSSRCRRRTTMPRSRPGRAIAARWRRSAPWPRASATATQFASAKRRPGRGESGAPSAERPRRRRGARALLRPGSGRRSGRPGHVPGVGRGGTAARYSS